jgi:hypothetical protein
VAATSPHINGQAHALTVLLPLKRWGRWYFTIFFGILRLVPSIRMGALNDTDRLRFIYAIRWSLIAPFEHRRRFGRITNSQQRWHLYFESNFDGEWDEYLDNFGAVLSSGLQRILVPAVGYPGLSSVPLFKAYARFHDTLPAHYYAAYPALTATDIRVHLAVTDRASKRGATTNNSGDAPLSATMIDTPSRTRLKADGFGLHSPHWLTLRIPLRSGQASAATIVANSFTNETSPFRRPHIHFARVAVVPQASRDWLVISMTYDQPSWSSPRDAIIRVLTDHAAVQSDPAVCALLDCCALGFTSPACDIDASRLTDVLMHYLVDPSLPVLTYCAYPATTVQEVQAALSDPSRLHIALSPNARC